MANGSFCNRPIGNCARSASVFPRLLLMAGLCAAAVAMPSRAALADTAGYRLDVGDVVNLVVLEKPEVSGGYRIDADGSINLPGLGVVNASGLTPRELEQEVISRAAKIINSPSVAVQIVEYRPFYIVGDVAKPGKYAYVPRINVLQAVSLAEGYFRRGGGEDFSQALAEIRARQGLASAQLEAAAASVKLSRLMAEDKDEAEFSFDLAGVRESLRGTVERMVEEERRMFIARNKTYSEQRSLVEEGIASRKKEQVAFEERLALQAELLKQLSAEVEQVKKLQKEGLTTTTRLNDLVREELRLQGEVIQIRIQAQQVASAISTDQQALALLDNTRRVAISEDIRATRDRVELIGEQIKGDRAVINEASGAPVEGAGGLEAVYTYDILRAGVANRVPSSAADLLLPGDTLIVRRVLPPADSQKAATTQ